MSSTSIVPTLESLFLYHDLRVVELKKKTKGLFYSQSLLSVAEEYLLNNPFREFDFDYFTKLAEKELRDSV